MVIQLHQLYVTGIQSGAKKTPQHLQNSFSHIYIYHSTPYYIPNKTQLDELWDGENCIKKYFTINILYDFENDL